MGTMTEINVAALSDLVAYCTSLGEHKENSKGLCSGFCKWQLRVGGLAQKQPSQTERMLSLQSSPGDSEADLLQAVEYLFIREIINENNL